MLTLQGYFLVTPLNPEWVAAQKQAGEVNKAPNAAAASVAKDVPPPLPVSLTSTHYCGTLLTQHSTFAGSWVLSLDQCLLLMQAWVVVTPKNPAWVQAQAEQAKMAGQSEAKEQVSSVNRCTLISLTMTVNWAEEGCL